MRDLDFGTSGKKLCHIGAELGVMMSGLHRAMADVFLLFACLEKLEASVIYKAVTEIGMPEWKLRANVSFADKDKAKKAGFQWHAESKQWVKTVKAKTFDDAVNPFFGVVSVSVVEAPEQAEPKIKPWAKRFLTKG